MADNGSSGEKSYEPTARRREKARESGQLVQSRELTGLAGFFAASAVLYVSQSVWCSRWGEFYQQTCGAISRVGATGTGLFPLLSELLLGGMGLVMPVLVTMAGTSVLIALLQTRFNFTLQPVALSFERLDPLKGIIKMFSKDSAIELLKVTLKTAGLVLVMLYGLRKAVSEEMIAAWGAPGSLLSSLTARTFHLSVLMMVWMAVLAGIDYFIQFRKLNQELMMTREELKKESKDTEANPKMKSRIRSLMKKMAGRRMMKQIPKASVIVTNPTHIAVALQYEPRMRAPIVLAKGADRLAERIKEIARQHNIPLVENVPLARVLYRRADVDEEVPSFLYQSVAEVLAYVYRLRRAQP